MMRWWTWLCCRLGYHNWFVVGRPASSVDHIACARCWRQWGMNHDVQVLVPWSDVRMFHVDAGYDDRGAIQRAFARRH